MEKKFDPGWNDPPMLNYSASNPPPKSRITNKRVAFPLNSTQATKSHPMSSHQTQSVPLPTLPSPSNVVLDIPVEMSMFIKLDEHKQVFNNLWKEDKFPNTCKESIQLLCKCLKENDVKNVMEIKEKLLAEYKSLCDMWVNSIEI